MAAELPRPGVEIMQVRRTVSPTVVSPTLVPCVIGVCKQVVSVLEATGAGGTQINPYSMVALPAQIPTSPAMGSPAVYGGLDGKKLVLSVNNGPDVTVTFSGNAMSAADAAAQTRSAFAAQGVTSALAGVLQSPQGTHLDIRTVGTGSFQVIEVKGTSDPETLQAFGITAGHVFEGASAYTQDAMLITQNSFPDPRGNLEELAIEPDTIRVFLGLGTGTNLRELSKTEAYLRRGGGGLTAEMTGAVQFSSLAFPGDLDTKELTIAVDGKPPVTVVFASPSDEDAVVSQINSALGLTIASKTPVNPALVLTSPTSGGASSVVVDGSAVALLGLPASASGQSGVAVVDDGNGDTVSPILEFTSNPAESFTASATVATHTGSVDITSVDVSGLTLELQAGNGARQTLTFEAGTNTSAATLLAINTFFPRLVATLSGNNLVLTSLTLGEDGTLRVLSGTAVTPLGLTVGDYVGAAHPPVAGDELYVDGRLVGQITKVAPGGAANRLRVDKQLPINADFGAFFYIVAKNLTAGASNRPSPELITAAPGVCVLKQEVLRDTVGAPVRGKAQIYLSYRAVRKDVTAAAKKPSLLSFDDTSQLDAIGPITAANPLALGLYLALLNAPGAQVYGLGVDEVSADAPYGTVEAFTRAAEFLEAYEVFALAPLTHDEAVAQVFATHVTAMSEPEAKGERHCIFNFARPTHRLDALVVSGQGNAPAGSGLEFDTGAVNLPAMLLAQGVDPVGTIPTSANLFVDIASDDKHYSVESVSGGVVTIRTSFAAGENTDGFFSTTKFDDPPLPSMLIDEPFALRIRGAALTRIDGSPDLQGVAETYQARSQSYLNRRFTSIVADTVRVSLGGLEQALEGFYLCAMRAGMEGQQPPQQSFTNFPMTGALGVTGTNKFFTEKQLNIIAAGGNDIIVQDTAGAPLISRMALTTDMTSIETRTDSIQRILDFVSKFLRQGLKNYIGRFNITQGFLDSLAHVLQGLLGFLTDIGVILGADVNNIIQKEDAPDTVLIDITIDPPYPCNYLRLTLAI